MTAYLAFVLRILLVLALYGFIGWIMYVLYMDLRSSSSKLTSRRIPAIVLALEEESDNAYSFTNPIVTIGRDPKCDLNVQDDTVSSLHARLSYHHNQWWIEDLQSTNGTFLNDERVFTPIVIISGDELRIGNARLMIEIKDL